MCPDCEVLKNRVKELENCDDPLDPCRNCIRCLKNDRVWSERDELKARLAPLLALALRHEWVHMGHLGERCPSCYEVRKSGHIPKCDWSAALAATEEGKG